MREPWWVASGDVGLELFPYMPKRKAIYDPETDRFIGVPNRKEYMFRVRHSRKQRILLDALRDKYPSLTDPAELTACEQMTAYLEKLLASRGYARTD